MKKIISVIVCLLPTGALAMADTSAPVYGRPTLYGEYEISAGDARRAAAMYGMVPKNAAEKMPVKPKKVMPKKSVKKKKVRSAAKAKQTLKEAAVQKTEPEVIVVPPRAVPEKAPAEVVKEPLPEKKAPMPSAEALAIAGAAATPDAPSIESFCTRRGTLQKDAGNSGLILMPGRPDLMSCSDR